MLNYFGTNYLKQKKKKKTPQSGLHFPMTTVRFSKTDVIEGVWTKTQQISKQNKTPRGI